MKVKELIKLLLDVDLELEVTIPEEGCGCCAPYGTEPVTHLVTMDNVQYWDPSSTSISGIVTAKVVKLNGQQ